VGLIDALMISKTVLKSESSVYAEHGTGLHEITEKSHNDKSVLDGLETDDKFLVTECLDYLDILCKSKGHTNYLVMSESRISLDKWGIPDVWGTLDYRILDPIKRHLDVIDWKFGAGVIVYAKKNPQLLAYAAGAVEWPTTIQSITLHVVQPAIENFSTWDLTTSELYDWVHGTLALAINKCSDDSTEFNPGMDSCRWCEARNHCTARFEYAQDMAIKLFAAHKTLATCPQPEELVKLIQQAPLVEKVIKDIRLYMQNEMLKGVEYPGMKLVSGRSNRKWINEKETVDWLLKFTDIEEFYTSKIRSPSQMEKEVKTLKKNENFKSLYEQPDGKVTLVSEADKRPAIQSTLKAVDVFADYQAPEKLE
jgi:hypothetical protein